jgi:hypothetical protein
MDELCSDAVVVVLLLFPHLAVGIRINPVCFPDKAVFSSLDLNFVLIFCISPPRFESNLLLSQGRAPQARGWTITKDSTPQ